MTHPIDDNQFPPADDSAYGDNPNHYPPQGSYDQNPYGYYNGQYEPPQEPKKSNTALIVVLSVIGVLLLTAIILSLIGVGALLLDDKSEDNPTTQHSSTVPSPVTVTTTTVTFSSESTPSTSLPTTTSEPSASSFDGTVPGSAVECAQDVSASRNTATSFCVEVGNRYYETVQRTGNYNQRFYVLHPNSGDSHLMTCVHNSELSVTRCTGGNNSEVYIGTHHF